MKESLKEFIDYNDSDDELEYYIRIPIARICNPCPQRLIFCFEN
jgi:hypothetical protein